MLYLIPDFHKTITVLFFSRSKMSFDRRLAAGISAEFTALSGTIAETNVLLTQANVYLSGIEVNTQA